MGATFPHPDKLINVKMVDNAINPWELHDFLYPHFAIPHPMSCIIGYTLRGDVPKGLSVDMAGNISGKIKHFGEQPSCSNNKPNKSPVLNGDNWDDNGRFKPQTYDFKFTITVNWLEVLNTPNGPVPCTVPGSTDASCTITVVKNHNIDNQIWLDEYAAKFPIDDKADPKPLQPI